MWLEVFPGKWHEWQSAVRDTHPWSGLVLPQNQGEWSWQKHPNSSTVTKTSQRWWVKLTEAPQQQHCHTDKPEMGSEADSLITQHCHTYKQTGSPRTAPEQEWGWQSHPTASIFIQTHPAPQHTQTQYILYNCTFVLLARNQPQYYNTRHQKYYRSRHNKDITDFTALQTGGKCITLCLQQ